MLELCITVHGPAPRLYLAETRRLAHRLAKKSQDICQKLFEVEFPSAIDVVTMAFFEELYHIFGNLFKLAPLGLAHSTFEPHTIHLSEIFATFGLVCKV